MEGFRDSPPDFNGRKSQITPGAAHVTGPNGSPLTTILTAGGGIGILVLSGVVNTEHDRCMTVSVRHSRAANGPVDGDRGCEQSMVPVRCAARLVILVHEFFHAVCRCRCRCR